jgi:hypothetical protein
MKIVDPPALLGVDNSTQKMIFHEIRRKNSKEGQSPHSAVERMITMMPVMEIMMVMIN